MARPGMVLAMPIRHPRIPDALLLNAGAAVDEPAIQHLREIGIPEMWIRVPELEYLSGFVSTAMQASCAQAAAALSGVFEYVRKDLGGRVDFYPVRRAVCDLLEEIVATPTAALYINDVILDDQALRHAGNVAFLSLLLGLKLEGYLTHQRARLSPNQARDITPLGIGALLHDIGMQKLSPPIVDRWLQNFDESDPEWRSHTLLGYQMVQGEIEPSAAATVLHHHQRFDGTGFPAKVDLGRKARAPAGSKIHVFPRIVAAADLFDRLRWQATVRQPNQPLTPAMPVVRVLNEMRSGAYSRRIDPVVFRALVHVVPPYPPGSLVTLSNGMTGVVAEWSANHPCRPIVDCMGDISQNWRKPGKPVRFDLAREKELFVCSAEGFDVSKDNFEPHYPQEFDLALFFKALHNAAVDHPEGGGKNAA